MCVIAYSKQQSAMQIEASFFSCEPMGYVMWGSLHFAFTVGNLQKCNFREHCYSHEKLAVHFLGVLRTNIAKVKEDSKTQF